MDEILRLELPHRGDAVHVHEHRAVAVEDDDLLVRQVQREPETDGREGLKSLEILVAAYKSARDGKRVALPLEY